MIDLQTIKISFYLKANDNKGSGVTMQAAIDLVKGNGLKNVTNVYHTLEAGPEKDEYKKTNFPAVTWSGEFALATCIKNAESIKGFLKGEITWLTVKLKKLFTVRSRAIEQLAQHSGYICIDIDKLTKGELNSLKYRLKKDKYVFFLFTSPSGAGIKIILKINIQTPFDESANTILQQHLTAFLSIQQYFKEIYKIDVDQSGKDVSRLCFLCADPDAYFNNDSAYFPVNDFIPASAPSEKSLPPQKNIKLSKPQEKGLQETALTANDVFEFTQNIKAYAESNRNNFVHLYACNCNRRGLLESECLSFALQFASDLKESEVKATVKSAYQHNTNEHGKFARRNKNVPPAGTGNNKPGQRQDNGNSAETVKFWYITEKEKNGVVTKSFNIDYNLLKKFLVQQGFFRLPLKDGNYQFIKITGNRVKPVTPLHIRDFIFEHLEARNEYEATNSLTRGGKQYLSTDKFERLPYKEVEIKKHTATTAYFYYKNGMVEVTPDDIVLHPYEKIKDSFIWDASINKRSVEILKDEKPDATMFPEKLMQSEIYRFLWLASFNTNTESATNNAEKVKEEHIQKFASICTAIGYLLHQHKTPSKAKAIIAIDHQIPADRTEQNGGTGKSIVGNYILKNVLNIATIPGKDYKEDNPWRWEPITIDSQVIFFNDVKYNFNFEGIFEMITDDMLINRRNIGYLSIPFEQSPKIYIATNYIVKGDGTSFRRRTHIIEFDNYFNESHTPHDEFGHNMFSDWYGENADQWNLYDNFIFRSVQMYLQEGLLAYPGGNYEHRKLISECPQEFIDWMDYYVLTSVRDEKNPGESKVSNTNRWIEKKEMLRMWTEEAKSLALPAPSAHSFTKMVKKYCNTGNKIQHHIKKTNGKEFYCFGTPPTVTPTNQAEIVF